MKTKIIFGKENVFQKLKEMFPGTMIGVQINNDSIEVEIDRDLTAKEEAAIVDLVKTVAGFTKKEVKKT